jgi:hypothetical protein
MGLRRTVDAESLSWWRRRPCRGTRERIPQRGGRGDGSTGPGRPPTHPPSEMASGLRVTLAFGILIGGRPAVKGNSSAGTQGPIQKEPEQLHVAHRASAISRRVPVSRLTGQRPSSRPPPTKHSAIDALGLHYNAELRWRPSFRPGEMKVNRRRIALPHEPAALHTKVSEAFEPERLADASHFFSLPLTELDGEQLGHAGGQRAERRGSVGRDGPGARNEAKS